MTRLKQVALLGQFELLSCYFVTIPMAGMKRRYRTESSIGAACISDQDWLRAGLCCRLLDSARWIQLRISQMVAEVLRTC